MPRISYFHGITIAMFWDETHHRRPHFHAEYGGHHASMSLDGTVVAGSLPPSQLRLVREWSSEHRDELEVNWMKARWASPSIQSILCPSVCSMEKLVDVVGVEVLDDYVLRLTFEDGLVGDVSFVGREWRGVFEPFKDPVVFSRVDVDRQFGTVVWPEHGLDMAPETLYEKAIQNPVGQPSTPAGS